MKHIRRRTHPLAVLPFIFLFMAGCLSFGNIEDRMTKTFPVGSGGVLLVETDIGSISVEGGNTDSVDIEILRQVRTDRQNKADEILEDFDIQFNQTGNDISVSAKFKKRGMRGFWDRIGNKLRVKFIITVPAEFDVDLNTRGGSITVHDIRGEVLTKTSGGSLTFDNIEGNLTGKTSGGSIRIGRMVGRSDIHTSGGSIRIRSAEGPVNAETSGGSIVVEEVMGTIKAHTSGGSVKAFISKQPDSDCSLTTSGGSITVQFSTDVGLDLDAKTSGGRIHTDFDVTMSGDISKNAIRAQINGGGPELYLRTSGGSIYLKRL